MRSAVRAVTTRSADQREQEPWVPWANMYAVSTLRKMQEQDPYIGPIFKWFSEQHRPTAAELAAKSPATRHYCLLWKSLEFRDRMLFRKFHRQDGTGTHLQFLVPKSLKNEVMYQMHNTLLSGHLGKKKSREKLAQRFYWFEFRIDVDNHVRKCDNCARNKKPTQTPRAPLGRMKVGAPLDRLSTDILGPLPLTPRGNRYILVVTDHFTKWTEIFPVPDQTATTCADKILNEVISRFGSCLDLHSDQGRNYESAIFADLCRLLEIRKTRTTARNPRCNGQTERYNRTLIRMIKAYLRGEQEDWDLNLGCLAAAYRATPHETTGMTPNLLMLGREVRLPAEVVFGSSTSEATEISSYGDYVDLLREKMQHAHYIARKHIGKAAEKQESLYDAKKHLNSYDLGDAVWYLNEARYVDKSPKLQSAYLGPYVVIKKLNEQDYMIQIELNGKTMVVHHNKLKPYEGENPPKWAKAAIRKQSK